MICLLWTVSIVKLPVWTLTLKYQFAQVIATEILCLSSNHRSAKSLSGKRETYSPTYRYRIQLPQQNSENKPRGLYFWKTFEGLIFGGACISVYGEKFVFQNWLGLYLEGNLRLKIDWAIASSWREIYASNRPIRLTQHVVPNSNLPGLRFFVYCTCIIMWHSHLNVWKFLKQKFLFLKGLNWVQHWVSRIGLFAERFYWNSPWGRRPYKTQPCKYFVNRNRAQGWYLLLTWELDLDACCLDVC